ncbi:hypothetical protein ACFVY0_44205 [Streptomyces sp. NPDC058286]|uniref:hypothetical protein n=1 Tax=Streptomyces sp. NPDC058286 TaxID=3346422 RepID=UPI0036EF3D18
MTDPHPPIALGALVLDTQTDRVGVVTGRVGPNLQLRPPGGGAEWAASPDGVRPAGTLEVLRAKVTEQNHRGTMR